MSGSDRGIILAIVGWLAFVSFISWGAAQQQQSKAEQGTEARQPAQGPIAPPSAWRPYPDMNADACYHADNKDKADLCAQWRAALAAEESARQAGWATFWSVVASVLSLATVVGLTITIWQTQGALKEARRGNRINVNFERRARRESRASAAAQAEAIAIAARNADAAAKLADVSEKSTRLQIRAYLFVKDIKIIAFAAGTIYGDVIISNAGTTPATIKRARRRLVCDKFGQINPAAVYAAPSDYYQFPSSLPPSGEFTIPFEIDDVDLEADFKSVNGSTLYVYGVVEFVDVFGDTQDLRFSYRVKGSFDGVDTEFVPSIFGNTAT